MKKGIELRRIFHRERWRYGIFFDYDQKLISLLRQVKGAAFSKSNRCWYVDDTEENLKQILSLLRDNADISAISSRKNDSTRSIEFPPDNEKGTVSYPPPLTSVRIQSSYSENRNEPVKSTSDREKNKTDCRKNYGPVEFTINESDDRLIIRFTGRYQEGCGSTLSEAQLFHPFAQERS